MAINAIKYLSHHEWLPIVVASRSSREFGIDPQSAQTIPDGLTIIRTRSWEGVLIRLLNRLGWVTDAMVGWSPFALSAARRVLRQDRVDAVVSRANPITSHLVAYRIARGGSSKLPWIALFGDPWTQNPYARPVNRWIRRWREGIERRILRSADAVVVTTEPTKQLLADKYGFTDKIHVLPNTYDLAELCVYRRSEDSLSAPNHSLVITHAGSLYGMRSPEPLFKALALLRDQHPEVFPNLVVRLVGALPQFIHLIDQYRLKDVVHLSGVLSRADTLSLLGKSDLLLVVDAPSRNPSLFLPAKLIEYLAFHKPILAITPPGVTADLVRNANVGSAVNPIDTIGLVQAITQYYQLHQTGQLRVQPNQSELDRYSAANYAEQLSALLDRLIAR